MTAPVGVSVVIPTYKRKDLLARCLKALARQTFDAEATEVIVCDDGPDADTRALVEAMAARVPFGLRYLPIGNTQGPAAARNCGWRAARHDVVAFTDDDTIPEPEWLAAGTQAIRGALAVSGRVRVPLPAEPTDYEKNESGLERAEFVTANCFVRRGALEALGGFDERFTAAWREDSDLHFGILQLTMNPELERVVRCDNACVLHPVRPAGWGVSIRQQKKSVFNALLFAKHPLLYRQRIEPHAPRDYYLAAFSSLAAVLGVVLDLPVVASTGALVWLFITGAFCMRRLEGTSRRLSHRIEMVATSIVIPWAAIYWRIVGAWRFRVPLL